MDAMCRKYKMYFYIGKIRLFWVGWVMYGVFIFLTYYVSRKRVNRRVRSIFGCLVAKLMRKILDMTGYLNPLTCNVQKMNMTEK